MSQRPQFLYLYDGTFPGFLTCVFESYAKDEEPACFARFDDPRTTLWPERAVETDRAKAERVYRSLSRRVSPEVQRWVRHGFLVCAPEKERRLYDFIRLAYRAGPAVIRDLTDPRVAPLHTALLHLWKEAHLFQGFVRFSDQGGRPLRPDLPQKPGPPPAPAPLLRPVLPGTASPLRPHPQGGPPLRAPAVGHPPPGGVPSGGARPGGAGLPGAVAAVLRHHRHPGAGEPPVPHDPHAQAVLGRYDRVPDRGGGPRHGPGLDIDPRPHARVILCAPLCHSEHPLLSF